MEERGMLSMGELDAIKGVDKEAGTITVQAGARVSQILSELQKHGLTLENFSSITEAWHKSSAFKILEKLGTTYCVTYDELERDHKRLLQTYRHVRYMWVPYTDTIVVVVSDVAEPGAEAKPALPEEQRVEPLKVLLRSKNFAQLRERLLELDPLDPAHVAKVNQAEAEFWRRSAGERIADSTETSGVPGTF
eukprot:s318_g13.t1